MKGILDYFSTLPNVVRKEQEAVAHLDKHTRNTVNKLIEEALHPKGMSTHSGLVRINAMTLRRLINIIDTNQAVLNTLQDDYDMLEASEEAAHGYS